MPNPVVHFEIAGRDGPALERFYSTLFGWKVDAGETGDSGENRYAYIDTGAENALRGGIRHEPEGPAEVVLYVEVDDLEASVEEAERQGATVRIPPVASGAVRFALISDPEGNPVGLLQKRG